MIQRMIPINRRLVGSRVRVGAPQTISRSTGWFLDVPGYISRPIEENNINQSSQRLT